jgi:hypothetical protein
MGGLNVALRQWLLSRAELACSGVYLALPHLCLCWKGGACTARQGVLLQACLYGWRKYVKVLRLSSTEFFVRHEF